MKQKIKGFIESELLGFSDNESLGEDEDILVSAKVDSMGIVRLIGYIEDEFGVKVPPEDMVIENFQSVEKIAEYLQGRAG